MHRRLLVEEVDGLLSLTAGGLAAARAAYPELADAPGAVTPHGHYRDDYDFTAARDAARAERGVPPDATLVVSVGMIRAYKNIPDLVRTVAGTSDPALVLAIAGRPAGDLLADEIRSAAADDSRIVLDLAFQSDAAIASWLRAADLVVLPYRAIQNSGSAILALSADRPVVVPALGAMRELQAAVGEDWVRCYEGEFDARSSSGASAGRASRGRNAPRSTDSTGTPSPTRPSPSTGRCAGSRTLRRPRRRPHPCQIPPSAPDLEETRMSATDPVRRADVRAATLVGLGVAALAIAVAAVAATVVAAPAAASDPLPAGTYTMSFSDAAASEAAIDALGVIPLRRYDSVITGFTAKLTSDQATSVAAAPGNVGLLADTSVTALAQTVTPAVRTVEADKPPVSAGSGAAWTGPNVAVLDSGVSTHPDLNLKSAVNCFTTGTGADVDGHGTGVSGVMARVRQRFGTRRRRARRADLLGARDGRATTGARCRPCCARLDWVADNATRYDIKVVNMSISAPGADDGNCGYSNADALHQAICSLVAHGVCVVGAAGNSTANMAGYLPATYDEVLDGHERRRLRRQAGRNRAARRARSTTKDDTPAVNSNFAVSALPTRPTRSPRPGCARTRP